MFWVHANFPSEVQSSVELRVSTSLLGCRNVVNILSTKVSGGRIVGHNHHLASLLSDTNSNISASLPHHLGEMASDWSTHAWFFSKGVILDLRVPTVDGSLCLILCSSSAGHEDVFTVVVVRPVLEGAFSYEVVSPFLSESIELGVDLECSHSVLGSVVVVRCQGVLPELVNVHRVSVQLLGAFPSSCTAPAPGHAFTSFL